MDRDSASASTARDHQAWGPALLFISVVAIGLIGLARWGTIIVVLELLAAILVVSPCVLMGSLLVPAFRLGRIPTSEHLLYSITLGLGLVSIAVLIAGIVGALSRNLFAGVLVIGAIVGGLHLIRTCRGNAPRHPVSRVRPAPETRLIRWAWVMPCPFLVLALCGAATAPGLIWGEEGNGYDILEYHLQVPKEYYLAGSIEYLPHNVYANFPSAVEMLYLLAMLLLDEVQDAAVTANFIHLLLGALTVYAAWAVARPWGRLAGLVSAVLLGSSGWLVYLSGLAYVEHGLLLFGIAATGAALRMYEDRDAATRPLQGSRPTRENELIGEGNCNESPPARVPSWGFLAGVLAGLACGCKYTAVPFVAAPVGLMILLAPAAGMSRRAAHVLIFFLGVGASFSPWWVKNVAYTGNPVFPLANGLFQAYPPGWDAHAQALWDGGHTSGELSAGQRLAALWRHIPADRYGRFPWVAILLGILALWQRRISRADVALGLVLLIQLVIWLFGTHLFARFAVPMLIPLVLLSGRFVRGPRPMRAQRVRIGALAIGAVFHLVAMGRLYKAEWPGVVPSGALVQGNVGGMECVGAANRTVPPSGKIALLGEAGAFYFTVEADYWTTFNVNPIYEQLRQTDLARPFPQWLAEQGYSHLYVHWTEVRRLERTYGSNPTMTLKELESLVTKHRRRGLAPMCSVAYPEAESPTALPMMELFAVEP